MTHNLTPDAVSPNVLLLDDERFVRQLMVRHLHKLGFQQVSSCAGGHEALAVLDAGEPPIDLILFDLNMPDMDGIEFVRHVAERKYAGSLVLVSGEDGRTLQATERLVRAHRLALLGRLEKPVEAHHLAEMLSAWRPAIATSPRAPRKIYGADRIRLAIDRGELVNYYQPKVALATRQVTGVEALARWQHPDDGLVFPDQFIGVAEDTGLIDALTKSLLPAAIADARAWQAAGLDLSVAINVSMESLADVAFPDVAAAAVRTDGTPLSIVFEVTEGRLLRTLSTALDVLTRLRLKRFRLSIDDFGTGHSSLTQLRDMPFDELKIDRGFTHGAWHDERQRAMFDASVGIATQLGMELVAEGVEDADDWAFVRQTGCQTAQGYYIARPMPAALVPDWTAQWQSRRVE